MTKNKSQDKKEANVSWIVYTDGGCTGNPGPGGWAALLLLVGEQTRELAGGERLTTNNRMELIAVITALRTIVELSGDGARVELHTDSQYVQKGISLWIKNWQAKGWKTAAGKAVKNKDLWIALQKISQNLRVDWCWVKGHAGNPWNERCDALVAEQRARF